MKKTKETSKRKQQNLHFVQSRKACHPSWRKWTQRQNPNKSLIKWHWKLQWKGKKIKGDKPRIMIPEFPEKPGIKLYVNTMKWYGYKMIRKSDKARERERRLANGVLQGRVLAPIAFFFSRICDRTDYGLCK